MSAIPRQGTDAWVEWRRGGIGASELPAIIGEDPYRSEYELALLKRGDMEPEPENEAMRWGHRVQRLAVEAYVESTGRKVRNVNTTAVSRTFPHVYASLDGRVVGERRGVEVKLTRAWTEPPRRVIVQCQAQMGVCGLDAIDVVRVGMGYGEPAITTIERDESMAFDLLEMGEAWYQRYVLGDEMPPVDGSRGAGRALDRIEGPPDMVADGDQSAMVTRLGQLKAAMKAAESEHDLLVNRLKESMQGAYTLAGQGFHVTWKPSKPRTTTDWRGVAEEMGASPVLVARYTTTGEGARPFRLTLEEGEQS